MLSLARSYHCYPIVQNGGLLPQILGRPPYVTLQLKTGRGNNDEN